MRVCLFSVCSDTTLIHSKCESRSSGLKHKCVKKIGEKCEAQGLVTSFKSSLRKCASVQNKPDVSRELPLFQWFQK